jgi:hypothetical protein
MKTEIFIKKAQKVHGDRYDYSLVDYRNNYTKIKIICKKHGVFEQKPNSHLNGQNCLKCVNENQTCSTEDFIKKAQKVHADRYDYSLVNYINNNTNVKIICKKHGVFEQRPTNHLTGNGCVKCARENRRNKNYIERCKNKFKNKYNYSLVDYKNNKKKESIICPIHGVFKQSMKDHLKSTGCPYCAEKRMNTKFFIIKSNKKHNNYYNYSLVKYKGAFKKVKIICPHHGIFEQVASTHLYGSGCPICKSSKGEKEIISYLEEKHIKYIHQKEFDGCYFKCKLAFDFYLPDYNICIEYNGVQHYEPCEYFGGIEAFKFIKERDKIKKNYCIKNKIKFRTISYKNNIYKKLEKILNE